MKDGQTQTTYTCHEMLSSKIDSIIRKRQSANLVRETNGEHAAPSGSLLFADVSHNEGKFKFYSGLSVIHFCYLIAALGAVTNGLHFWRDKRTSVKASKADISCQKYADKNGRRCQLSIHDQLLLTLMIRQGFPNRDLAHCFHLCGNCVYDYQYMDSAVIYTYCSAKENNVSFLSSDSETSASLLRLSKMSE